jgi:PPOX class probable F420-dependent enzyme
VSDAAIALGVPESHTGLLSQPLVGVFTTIGPDGLPQSTALWYLLDEGELKISVMTSRQKYKNLLANPRATLFILDPSSSGKTLEIRGEVEIRPDPDKAQAALFAATYGSAASQWDPEGATRALLVLRPKRIVAFGA